MIPHTARPLLLLLLCYSRCAADDAPYLSNWFTPYPHSTTLHLNLWQRFVNSYVIPAQIVASMWHPMRQLNKVKQQCGIKLHVGSPVRRHAHALKIINSFFGFEVSRDKLLSSVQLLTRHFAKSVQKKPACAQQPCLCKTLEPEMDLGPLYLVYLAIILPAPVAVLADCVSLGRCACSRRAQ
jgi:hypothetical protein